MSARLMEILASLARRQALRTLHTICETQHQVTTSKLEKYLEPIGDELAGYAFHLRMEYDALSAKLADAQRLLAERDAEIERLKSAPCECGAPVGYVSGDKYEASQQRIRDYRARITALEAQQAASVGGEREVCDTCHGQGEIYSGEDQHFGYFSLQPPEPIMITCPECSGETVAALSPAGGGVVMPERKPLPNEYGSKYQNRYEAFCQDLARAEGYNEALDEVARLNAKPQANSQWLAPEDELNVALVLGHAEDLRLQGHPERADALVQAAEGYVSILAEVQAAQRGMRHRAGEL